MRIDHDGPLIRMPEQILDCAHIWPVGMGQLNILDFIFILDCSAFSFEVVTNCDHLINLPFPGFQLRTNDLKISNFWILKESYDNLMRI